MVRIEGRTCPESWVRLPRQLTAPDHRIRRLQTRRTRMATTTTAPAGWYPDTTQPGTERYWDGQQWTDETRAAQVPQPQARGRGKTPEAKAAAQATKAEAKAAREAANAQAKAERASATAQAKSDREAAQKEQAFRASPVGQALSAKEQKQGFFEVQLVVGQ